MLLGVGHTNAHILKMWRMKAIPRTRLTCISNFPLVTYSGMLPGVLAGQYAEEQMQIDLVRLTSAVGARLILDEVVGLDQETDALLFRERPPLPFDVLSVGIGSLVRSAPRETGAGETVTGDARRGDLRVESPQRILIKPMQTFLPRLRGQLRRLSEPTSSTVGPTERHLAIVGAGAGGFEVAMCIRHMLATEQPGVTWRISLFCGSEILPDFSQSARQRAERALRESSIDVHSGTRVLETSEDGLVCDDGRTVPVDLAIWASGATSPPLLEELGLPTDDRGFLTVDKTLQSTSGRPIFAVGDAAALPFDYVTKAGVYAVREGPVLWSNIGRMLDGRPLTEYRPQRDFLRLLNTGDGRAIGQYRRISFHTSWAWKWKDRIDVRFMRMYQDYQPMPMGKSIDGSDQGGSDQGEDQAMRCLGCGGKIGGSLLQEVLSGLEPYERPETVTGIAAGGDDAAILRPATGQELAATTDFFVAPWDDAYTVGKVAALHAASDAFAMGSDAFAALANVTLPLGKPRRQEQCLRELLGGANDALREMKISLVGGHTIEGPHLAIGFTILAQQGRSATLKSRLRPGDHLVLTKPIGIGVLLAAHMQARCRGEWWPDCVSRMLESNGQAAKLATDAGATAMTDVTGFGLAGHLGEMLKASTASAEISLAAIPLLAGARQLAAEGIASTLAPANRDWEQIIDAREAERGTAEYSLLFDPQTSGGLLIAVDEATAADLLTQLSAIGCEARSIGRITEKVDRAEHVRLRVTP